MTAANPSRASSPARVRFVILNEVLLATIVVDDARQSAAEAGDVRAPVDGVDAVGERVDELCEAVIVLHRHLDDGIVDLLLHINGVRVDDGALLVQAAHETGYAALEVVSYFVVGP